MSRFFGSERMDEDVEEDVFRKYGLPTKKYIGQEMDMDVDEGDTFEMESEKFYISSHGLRLLHPDFQQITIPANMYIYFQSQFGNECARYDWEDMIPYICYHQDFLDTFRNVSTGGWINMCPPGTVIYDCLLTPGERFLSNVMVCDRTVGPQIIMNLNPGGVLLSSVLRDIMGYATLHRLNPPYNIFCSFCLVDNHDSFHELQAYYSSRTRTGGKRKGEKERKRKIRNKNIKYGY